jgi:hypothetical protein
MAKIPRKTQQIFAGNNAGAPSGIIAQFGSLAASALNYSSDPAVIQALTAYLNGWQNATVNNKSPSLQDMNALFFLLSYQAAYGFQAGIPEWDAATTYYTGSWVNVAGVAYISKVDTNLNNNPITGSPYDTTHWQSLADQVAPNISSQSLQPRAWCNFDGSTIGGTGGGSLTIRQGGILRSTKSSSAARWASQTPITPIRSSVA